MVNTHLNKENKDLSDATEAQMFTEVRFSHVKFNLIRQVLHPRGSDVQPNETPCTNVDLSGL